MTRVFPMRLVQGLYSLSGKTSYRQISWSLEAARLDVAMAVSLWNLTGTSAPLLPRYLPNFRAIGKVWTRISRLRDFTRSCGKTSYSLVNRGPDEWQRTRGCEINTGSDNGLVPSGFFIRRRLTNIEIPTPGKSVFLLRRGLGSKW